MNRISLRLKNNKKAITPVIATIILIAVTLVLALVVGAYTFGLFGSNVKTITLSSVTLTASNGDLTFALSNPGSAATITSMTLSGASLSNPITSWTYTVGGTTGLTAATAAQGTVTTITAVPASGLPTGGLTSGQTFNYVIAFSNGQSITGAAIAQ